MNIENRYLTYSLLELRIEIFKRRLQEGHSKFTFEWIANKLGKTKATISYVLNDTDDLSPQAKAKIRKRICTLLEANDRKATV